MNNLHPHISINKLGEFIYATASKQKSILKTMKFPSTFKIARYPEPQSAFLNFMADSQHDLNIFEKKKQLVASKNTTSDWVRNNKECCLLALNCMVTCMGTSLAPFLRYCGGPGLAPQEQNTLNQNVTIHIKPDVILYDSKTREIKGAIKLIFSKSREIELQEGIVIAAAIKSHLEKVCNTRIKSENCVVLDVFHKRKFVAPKFLQTVKVQMKMACREIIDLWPTI